MKESVRLKNLHCDDLHIILSNSCVCFVLFLIFQDGQVVLTYVQLLDNKNCNFNDEHHSWISTLSALF